MRERRKRRRGRTVFYSVAAQWDNLGDIEIRDNLLAWLRGTQLPVVAYTGSMPAQYLAAFSATGVTWEPSASRYMRSLWWALLRGRAHIVFAPGPQVLVAGIRPMAKSFVNLCNVAAVRASGGAAVAVGRSFRGGSALARAIEAVLVRAFTLFTVRDDRSSAVLGMPLRLAPDLAFAHGAVEPGRAEERRTVAVSLRGDRPFDVELVEGLVRRLGAAGLTPVLVTQVKRDDAQHDRLARELGVEALLWGDRDHEAQRTAVRAVYRRSVAVVSNRLHALLMGLREGAVPVAITEPGIDKLKSTLGPWVPYLTASSDLTALDGEAWDVNRINALSPILRHKVEAAVAETSRLRVDVVSALTR